MEPLTHFLPLSAIVFVCALGGIVVFRLVTGSIVTRGLITDSVTGEVSATKLQLLLASVVGAFVYAGQIAAQSRTDALPAVDRDLLLLVGGSNGFMLGGLALNRLRAVLGLDR